MTPPREGEGEPEEWLEADSNIGLRVRMRQLEAQQLRTEEKVDRLQWAIVAGAVGYLISIWTGLGGPG